MADQNTGTPSSGNQSQQTPSAQPANTPPASQPGAGTSPSGDQGTPSASIDGQAILAEINKFGGRLTKIEQAVAKGKKASLPTRQSFSHDYPPETPPSDEDENAQEREMLAFERRVAQIVRDPKYRPVLEADKTLAEIIDTNPIALVKDPIDVDDAIGQLEAKLQGRLQTPAPSTPPENPETPPQPAPANPPATTPPPKQEQSTTRLKSADEIGASLAERMQAPKQ